MFISRLTYSDFVPAASPAVPKGAGLRKARSDDWLPDRALTSEWQLALGGVGAVRGVRGVRGTALWSREVDHVKMSPAPT